ncbi:MAG: serine O-acetyltransferase EpsC [Erysipelotrichia bacterium]|nr:serine O-acetyltransferase EpsC [Erysipelotrichia bacterium]
MLNKDLLIQNLLQENEPEITKNTSLSGIKQDVKQLINYLQCSLYPEVFISYCPNKQNIKNKIEFNLEKSEQLLLSILHRLNKQRNNEKIVEDFFQQLPQVKSLLNKDIQAAYDGDPAAESKLEVIVAYPCFTAISIYRLSHIFYLMDLKILARIMSEYAHTVTAIDIHPGATIGEYFFIDHGTGVVIGETTVIGNHVKIYQGVTLGAKSFDLDQQGNPIKGIKRHPNIGNNVIIYAGATILGGNTYIGDNCVIGGNVWLTHSLEANKTIVSLNSDHKII